MHAGAYYYYNTDNSTKNYEETGISFPLCRYRRLFKLAKRPAMVAVSLAFAWLPSVRAVAGVPFTLASS